MSENKKTSWQYFLLYIWIPLSALMNAVDIIQLGENLWPALIQWVDFFKLWIEFVRNIRDVIFTPFDLVRLSIPLWLKDYLFFGFLLLSSYLASVSQTIKSKIRLNLKSLIVFLIMILVWPITLFIFAKPSKKGESNFFREQEEKYSLRAFLKTIGRIVIVTIILFFINYTIMKASGN